MAGGAAAHEQGCTRTAIACSGSIDDAEDALQDALLRAWCGLCGFDGRSALRPWLYRIDDRLPAKSQEATLPLLGDERVRALAHRFIDAVERGDVDAVVVGVLAEDARFFRGPELAVAC